MFRVFSPELFAATIGSLLQVAVLAAGCSDADSETHRDPVSGADDAGVSADGGKAASGDDGSAPRHALALPSPAERGPYEVAKDENVGMGYENPATNANDQGDGSGCLSFISMFGAGEETSRQYAMITPDYNIDRYTLYRPSAPRPDDRFPVLSWANGTCAKVPGYDGLLSHLASHGFIVIAANSRYTGSGEAQRKGVDWVLEQNSAPDSPLYRHVAVESIGLFGHSQGGASTWIGSSDARVVTSVVLNAGGMGTRDIPSFFLTGDSDVAFALNGSRSGAMAQASSAFIQLHKGSNHITLMTEPARVYPSVTAWFRYHLLKDDVGRSWFVGDKCELCDRAEDWEYIAKGLP